MAWIVAESRPLNSEEMRNNAQEQANYMINFGFTANAISAILGNEQSESTINPGRWQSDISIEARHFRHWRRVKILFRQFD